jgi:putative FmdB family regulatory protein
MLNFLTRAGGANIFIATLAQEDFMPTYEYQCTACRHKFTLIQTIAEHDKGKAACPKCKKKKPRQVISTFQTVTSRKS